MQVTDWIAAVVAVLALAISIAAFIYSRRATMASERQAAVAERQERRALEEAAERAVRWRFMPQPRVIFSDTPARGSGGDVLSITNEGDGTAYDVRVELRDGDQVIGGPLVNGELVHRGEWVGMPSATAGYGPNEQFLVYWRTAPDGPERSQRFDLTGRAR